MQLKFLDEPTSHSDLDGGGPPVEEPVEEIESWTKKRTPIRFAKFKAWLQAGVVSGYLGLLIAGHVSSNYTASHLWLAATWGALLSGRLGAGGDGAN